MGTGLPCTWVFSMALPTCTVIAPSATSMATSAPGSSLTERRYDSLRLAASAAPASTSRQVRIGPASERRTRRTLPPDTR